MYAPDIKDVRKSAKGSIPLASKCTSGSDIPLKGVFSLDPRESGECRPTTHSTGAVLLAQLQYNNVFGTPFSVKPTLFHTRGLMGMSPTPAGSFVEDAGRTALTLTAEYQSSLQIGLSYVDYFGEELFAKNIDQDTLSLSVSYAY